jgi:hypothetical protein
MDVRSNPMHAAITMFARGTDRRSLYDTRHWEICEGSEGLTRTECDELIAEWNAGECADFGTVVTVYEVRA